MLFEPYKIKGIHFKNRAVMAPMCMYQAEDDGIATDFHFAHYFTRAQAQLGLIILEATSVEPNGRISLNDLGIWSDDHIKGLSKIANLIKKQGAVAGIQINHAGRKARVDHPIAPSSVAFNEADQRPMEMSLKDIEKTVLQFKEAARRADQAGFDLLEIHAAHGYLIYQFLSPISNQRTDKYKDGTLFLIDIIHAIKEVWPEEKILAIRISATEYHEHGINVLKAAEIINRVKSLGIDLIDISSGGNVMAKIPIYPGYQLELSRYMKEHTKLPTIGGGLLTDLKLPEFALANGQADFIFFGRVLLREPHFLLNHAKELNHDIAWPKSYDRGK